ncbi:MAG: hypothetical protein ACE366_16005 [Bradymonadia bacterium]
MCVLLWSSLAFAQKGQPQKSQPQKSQPETTAPEAAPAQPSESFAGLIAKGDAAAVEGKTSEALTWWSLAYVVELASVRGLAFKQHVPAQHMTQKALQAHMLTLIDREYPPEKRASDKAALTAFGLIPPDLDLKTMAVELLAGEVAGFYDPESKELYLILREEGFEAPGLMDRLMGLALGDEEKMVLAHELTHALEDQHFDLFSMSESTKHDDDMAVALSSLVEGSAMVVMLWSRQPDSFEALTSAAGAQAIESMLSSLEPEDLAAASGDAFKKAPLILQTQMVYPYLSGLTMCLKLIRGKGWAAIDAAYTDPPISSEQVLHPERYLNRKTDPPLKVDFSEHPPGVDPTTRTAQNTLGELSIRVLLNAEADQGVSAADGWDGDGYIVYGTGEKARLLWLSVWENADEATAFEQALRRQRPQMSIARHGNKITALAGVPSGETEKMHRWLSSRGLSEKRFVRAVK